MTETSGDPGESEEARAARAGSRAERILVVTNNYPSRSRPNVGTFVRNLVEQWAAKEVPLAVVAPQAYWSATTKAFNLRDLAMESERALVLRPTFLSFSSKTLRPGLSTARLSMASLTRSVRKALPKVPFEPAVAYAHFIFPAAHAALEVMRGRGVPVVAAVGEAEFDVWEKLVGFERARATTQRLDAILSVSQENADYCAERYGFERDRIRVIPNAVDTKRFYPRDRDAMWTKLGLPLDRPIVAYTGNFIDRKGPLRVLEALKELPEVGAVFLGEGPQRPTGEQVLFADRVANSIVPEYLSAADLYALPTRAEGSPNSIIEAMACGLPIVSSDIPALAETVPPEGARLVPPDDVEAIRNAIRSIVEDDNLREQMSRSALAHATRTSLSERADRILEWLGGVIERGPR